MGRLRWTIPIALVAGVALAWIAAPQVQGWRAMRAVASPDAESRDRGWTWLLAEPETRLEPRRVRVNRRLMDADAAALRDAARALVDAERWRAVGTPPVLVNRIGWALAGGNPASDHRLAASLLAELPRSIDAAAWSGLFDALVASPDADAGRAALEAFCGYAGLDRAETLAQLAPPADPALRRTRRLALAWRPALTRPPPPDELDADVDVLEAELLHAVLHTPDDASLALDTLRTWRDPVEDPEPRRPCFPAILRYSNDAAAAIALLGLADRGRATARFALQARDPERDEAQSHEVLMERRGGPARQRMAAWRCGSCPDEARRAVVLLAPADPDGTVYAAAMLAERVLPHEEALMRAESWIRSLDDAEKRAGALLAALLGAHAELLRTAYDAERDGPVRTTQRLALWALGAPVGDDDPVEFAHRVQHGDDGDFRPDTVLCMLLAGETDALRLLTTAPPSGPALQRRAWLLERFVPAWPAAVGRPIGGDRRAARLHLDRLEALRALSARDMEFDPERRTYVAAGLSPVDALAAAAPPADDAAP